MSEPNPNLSTPSTTDQQIEQFALTISNQQKENDWKQLLVIFGLNILLLLAIIFVFYQVNLFKPINEFSLGLINETLIATLILLIIVVWLGINVYGNQEWKNIGVNITDFKIGYIVTFLIWIVVNLLEFLIGLLINGTIILNPLWKKYGFTVMLGSFIAQIFGVAIQEELLFRRYLFPQLTKKMSNKWPNNPTLAIFLGIILANTMFSLMHLPIRIYSGNDFLSILWNLFILLGLGVFFTLVYLLTENIWIAIGVHALGNAPTLIFTPVISAKILLYLMILIICLIWPKLKTQFHRNKNG